MSRRFIRHFFDFNDPFFFPSGFLRPPRIQFRQIRPIERDVLLPRNQPRDPQEIFDNFFNENEITESEKEFFKKNFPEKVQEKFDPFKVLEIEKNATEDQIKQAYRKLAIKYHPKTNTTPEAQTKFAQLGRAYEEAMTARNEAKYADLGFRSFFQDFDKQIENMFEITKEGAEKKKQLGGKQESKAGQKKDSWGELYSESSHVENMNGKQTKFVCEKKYKKDGQFLSVKREETLKDDGKTQIVETIDDGKQVKKNQYILDKEGKQAKKIEQKPKETK